MLSSSFSCGFLAARNLSPPSVPLLPDLRLAHNILQLYYLRSVNHDKFVPGGSSFPVVEADLASVYFTFSITCRYLTHLRSILSYVVFHCLVSPSPSELRPPDCLLGDYPCHSQPLHSHPFFSSSIFLILVLAEMADLFLGFSATCSSPFIFPL
jgi:hypothetical protein